MTTIETIELTETSRIQLEPDTDATCPRRNDTVLTGYVNIHGRGDSRLTEVPAVHDDPTGRIEEAWDRIDGVRYADDRGYYRAFEDEDVVIRWAKVFHGLHLEYDDEHGGFWFVSPAAFKESWPTEFEPGAALYVWRDERITKDDLEHRLIEQEQETYRQWAEGEAVGLILERSQTWCRLLDDGTADRLDTREEWEEAGSIWGVYLDDAYTARVVATENLDLTADEYAALTKEA